MNLSQIDGKNSIHGAFGILTIHGPQKFVQVFSDSLSEPSFVSGKPAGRFPRKGRKVHGGGDPCTVSSLFSVSRNHTGMSCRYLVNGCPNPRISRL